MLELDEAIKLVEETAGKMLLIDTIVLSLDAASLTRVAIAHLDQARAFLELAELAHARSLAERGRGR